MATQSTAEAVSALVKAGLVRESDRAKAERVIEGFVSNRPMNFQQDCSFLLESIQHHATTQYRHNLVPRVLAHNAQATVPGRLLKDAEIDELAQSITGDIYAELGAAYRSMLSRYFESDGLVAFVYSRVHAALVELCREFNENFLRQMHQTPARKPSEKRTA